MAALWGGRQGWGRPNRHSQLFAGESSWLQGISQMKGGWGSGWKGDRPLLWSQSIWVAFIHGPFFKLPEWRCLWLNISENSTFPKFNTTDHSYIAELGKKTNKHVESGNLAWIVKNWVWVETSTAKQSNKSQSLLALCMKLPMGSQARFQDIKCSHDRKSITCWFKVGKKASLRSLRLYEQPTDSTWTF